MASESTPPPPTGGGGARYAIAGVALAALAGLGYCLLQPPPPPPTTVATAPDAGVIERSTALVEDDLVIPEEEPDAGPIDAAVVEAVEPVHHGPRGPALGEWDSCTGELNALPVFQEYRPQFQACYEHRLKANPMLQGQMQLRVHIASDGHVDGVDVGGSLRDREVFTCVRNLANRMRFPHPTGGSCAVVAVPYTFTPQQ